MGSKAGKLVDRLRGIYTVPVNDGAGLLNGKDTFTNVFPVPPINHEAAEEIERLQAMLVFFFGQMQMHSPSMDGQHSYTFRSGGWPMTLCRGPTAMDAVQAAMAEIERSQAETREAGEWDKVADDEAESK